MMKSPTESDPIHTDKLRMIIIKAHKTLCFCFSPMWLPIWHTNHFVFDLHWEVVLQRTQPHKYVIFYFYFWDIFLAVRFPRSKDTVVFNINNSQMQNITPFCISVKKILQGLLQRLIRPVGCPLEQKRGAKQVTTW